METQQRTVISYAINFEKIWPFILFYGQFWSLGNLQNLCKQLYLSILLVLNIAVFICTLFVQVTTKNFLGGTLLAHFPRSKLLRTSLTHEMRTIRPWQL